MYPRNLTMFRFPPSLDLSELAARLAEFPLKPVGPLEMSSHGFVSPLGRDADQLLHQLDGGRWSWIAVGEESKILPGAVVNELLAKRVEQFEEQQGRKPGGKLRKQMKDDLLQELLPRAFVKPGRVDAFIDHVDGVVYVNTSSRKAAESVVSAVRMALGSFPALPLNAEVSPRGVMTGWIAGEPLGTPALLLGEEIELRDPSERGAIVRCSRQDLRTEEVQNHLDSGKQVTRVALNLDDHVSLVFGEDLTIRKFKLLDGAVESMTHAENEDLRAEMDARFALLSGELARLFAVLSTTFKISRAE